MKKNKLKIKYGNVMVFILMIICVGALIISSFNIIKWFKDNQANAKIQEEIKELIVEEHLESENDEEEKVIKYNIDFKSLKEQNSDVVAYLKVNNTNIDYVIVKGKDNSYYLKHNLNKEWNRAGWPFADFHNKFDETDKNIVIFGHNTKDGSMFGSLKNILDKEWYLNDENQMITLVTEERTYYYEVFSIYQIEREEYYINTQFKSDTEYEKFLKTINKRSLYDFHVDLAKEDRVLTLSTCTTDGIHRVVLHAKLAYAE